MIPLSMSLVLLSMPFSLNQVGYIVGSIGAFSAVLLYTYCMHMIINSEVTLSQRLHQPQIPYSDLLHHALSSAPDGVRWLSKYAGVIVRADFILIWGGGNSIYVIVISQNLKCVLEHFWGIKIEERVLILYLIIPLLLLCWIPNLQLLAICSTFSNIVNIGSLLVILFVVLQNWPSNLGQDHQGIGDVSKLPLFLGTIFITVNGTGPLLTLRRDMKHPEKFESKLGPLNVSFIPAGIFCVIFGLLCSIKYGQEIQENVILNLPGSSFSNAVGALYALALIFFYPLGAFVTYDIFWNEILEKNLTTTPFCKILWEYVVRSANAVGFMVLAFVIPNVALFISVTGTMCASLDSIILPGIVELLVFDCGPSRFAKNILLISFGVYLMVAGAIDAYFQVIRSY